MIDLVAAVVVLAVIGLIFYLVVVVGPARRETKAAVRLASRSIDADSNHQDMFLLFVELLALDDRGLFDLFPDNPTKERARALVADFRRQHTSTEPPKGLPS